MKNKWRKRLNSFKTFFANVFLEVGRFSQNVKQKLFMIIFRILTEISRYWSKGVFQRWFSVIKNRIIAGEGANFNIWLHFPYECLFFKISILK